MRLHYFARQTAIRLLVGAALIGLTACASVTIRPGGGPKLTTAPDYKKSKDYFFWGLGGVGIVDVVDICGENTVQQFQSHYTGLDVLYGFITLGIYMPETASVWCKAEAKP